MAIAQEQALPCEDDRIARVAHAALLHSGHSTLAKLDCRVGEGVIVISGIVGSFYLKQVAQESIRRTSSGLRIRNVIQVRPYRSLSQFCPTTTEG